MCTISNRIYALVFIQKALAGLRRIDLDGLRWKVFDAKGQVVVYSFYTIYGNIEGVGVGGHLSFLFSNSKLILSTSRCALFSNTSLGYKY